MDFALNDDQLAVEGALDKLAERFATSPVDFHGFALVSQELDNELEESQYFEIAAIPEMGPLSAALAVERLARLPYTAEIALSMLVRPHLDLELPRPIAVIENGRPGRYVASAKTLIVIDGDSVGIAHPTPDDVEALPDSLFAYPMGRLTGSPEVTPLPAEQAEAVRNWMRVACAAEMAGLLQAAVDATVEHISVRKQFGRPIGTFQALRHRIAECAVLTGGVRWLALKAAWSGDAGDAALAALHAQDSATRVIYDVHQMSGAMGMTLEMDLHLWTYRMKALISELGGRSGQAQAVAQHCFGASAA
ncbi:acyl-CoA dehydrogenase [Mangrovimicrobium sediminis]|uniref:Acyl-CoA dehydrogenase n=1 Tax=Mangrovimicrobium sediminis TaxID=2562682 RepID=A0A4Z0LVR6_9GAMM|nr:acyl-CoA dehydrogenase family protein [Haliea sp. SAOS-164]TGD71369.1 acyl-CoA dehydrogenase [Haliea sp. SAOS-164]